MSTEENKALMRRAYEEVFNNHNAEAIADFVAEDYVEHTPSPGQGPGIEGAKQYFRGLFTAFPDLHITVEDTIAEGDQVSARAHITGTHQGEFMGMTPTGRQVDITGMDWLRIAGGKVVEHWNQFDDLGMMQQLGVIPAPDQAAG